MKNITIYRIVAACDPYNARFHHHNEQVLKYDGATPIEWVVDDSYGDGYTLEEAYDILDSYANQLNDDTCYEDDASIDEMRRELEEYGEEADLSWYKGAGWYENNVLVYRHGYEYLRDDVVLYSIEEMEEQITYATNDVVKAVINAYLDTESDDPEGLAECLAWIVDNATDGRIELEKNWLFPWFDIVAEDVENYLK